MYILVIIGFIICAIASAKMNSTFNKYNQVRSLSGMTGAQVAELMLRNAGINDVAVRPVSGKLTDHYDPRTLTLNLSDSTYNSRSVAALGVAAHECGHAIQDAEGYTPLKLRGALVPVVNIGSNAAWPVIIIGAFINNNVGYTLIEIGIFLFSLAVIFQLVTLPVEFNASHRALVKLEEYNVLDSEELQHTKKVLSAAAMTYVASAIAIALQLLRLVLIFGGGRRR